MDLPENLAGKKQNEIEERFLNALSESELPTDSMISVTRWLQERGNIELADEWAELMSEPLAERGDRGGMLRVMNARAGWRGP